MLKLYVDFTLYFFVIYHIPSTSPGIPPPLAPQLLWGWWPSSRAGLWEHPSRLCPEHEGRMSGLWRVTAWGIEVWNPALSPSISIYIYIYNITEVQGAQFPQLPWYCLPYVPGMNRPWWHSTHPRCPRTATSFIHLDRQVRLGLRDGFCSNFCDAGIYACMHFNNMVPCQRSLTRDSGNFLQYAMICFMLFALKRLLFFMASTVIHLPSVSVWRLSSRSRTNLHFWMKSFCRARAGHACNVQWGFWNLYIYLSVHYMSLSRAHIPYIITTLWNHIFLNTHACSLTWTFYTLMRL